MSAGTLVSIITPSLNRVSMIAESVQSVQVQDYSPIEHIVVDGGSTDGTLAILAGYPSIRVVSGTDLGVYQALNKGLQTAQGELIGFLNTDDFYSEGIFTEVVDLFQKTHADAIAGQAVLFQRRGDGTNSVFRRTRYLGPQVFWKELTYGDPAFNAWFFHRRVFDQIGAFDTSYQLVSDHDLLLRFALSNLTHMPLERVAYWYRSHPDSLTFSRNLQGFSPLADENLRLVDQYLDRVPRDSRFELQRVRTRDTITAASRDFRAGAFARGLHYAQIGIRYDLLWPAKFFARLVTGIYRWIGRRLGFYPPI